MEMRLEAPKPGAHENELLRSLPVVIAYEDFFTGLKAKEFYDRLVRSTPHHGRFSCHAWKFETLQLPSVSYQSAEMAARAELTIVAAHEGTDLYEVVKHWLELWLAKREGHGLLVALLDVNDYPGGANGPVRCYLRRLARKGRMNFLYQEVQRLPTIPGLAWKPNGWAAASRAPYPEVDLKPKGAS